MVVDGITFPKEALTYLRRHKGNADLKEACAAQVHRARKQLAYLEPLLSQHKPRTLLDIGCGLAVVSTLRAKQGELKTLHLMDGQRPSPRSAEYLEGMQPWNDVKEGMAMVIANMPRTVLEICPHYADPEFAEPVDCIWSFKSWGIHYPMHTYIPLAQRCLHPGGLLIVDIRPDTLGKLDLMNAGFSWLQQVGDRGSVRHAFIKR